MISLTSSITKIPDLLTSEIDGKLVILGIDAGKYFAFDDLSTDIWNRIESFPVVADLCVALARDYDAPPETIQADVCRLLGTFVDNHLVSISNAA